MLTDTDGKLMGFIFGCLIVALIAVGINIYNNPIPSFCGVVVNIGGCDKNGNCGVVLDSKEVIRSQYPIVGQVSCGHKRGSP